MRPPGHDAERTCLACRRPRGRGDLVRIVRGPAGEACFDPDARLPGRGAYVCADPACLAGLSAGALAHALRAPVALSPAPERRAALARQLETRVANLLTMARRSRALVFGPAGVRAALRSGRAAALLLAADLPPADAAAWRRRAAGLPVRAPGSAARLGALAGREPFAVAALAVPGLAAALLRATDQWQAISPVS